MTREYSSRGNSTNTGRASGASHANTAFIVSDAIAVQPSVGRSDDEVAAIREQRAQRKAMAQQAQQAAAAAEGAKVLSQADTGGDNALTRLLGNVTGTPAPGTPAR